MSALSRDIVKELLRFYGKPLSEAQRLFYEAAMDDCDEDLLCKAVMHLKKQEPPNRLPTVGVLRKYYLEEKDAAWKKEKLASARVSDLERAKVAASGRAGYENFKALMGAMGKMPKSEWLKLGVESGMFTTGDAEKLKESWEKMGAGNESWGRGDLFER